MKKLSIILALILTCTLTACAESVSSGGSSQTTPEADQSGAASEEKEETPTDSAENTADDENDAAGNVSEYAPDDDFDWSIDPFDPIENLEFDSREEYEQYISGLDIESEGSPEELTAFLSENYEKARNISSFCRSLGAETLDIGVDFDNTVVFTYDDGFGYQAAPTDLSSKEEFWEYAAEYFSAATVEQLKNATADYLMYEADGVLYVAIGARGNNYWYDPGTVEIVRQTEDRATVSIVKDYFIEGEEKIALRDLVKEDGKWKFDFIM